LEIVDETHLAKTLTTLSTLAEELGILFNDFLSFLSAPARRSQENTE
jgi:hypothetical protein